MSPSFRRRRERKTTRRAVEIVGLLGELREQFDEHVDDGRIVRASSIYDVGIAIYHMFPTDSQNPPLGNVTTRANSTSDTEFTSRDSGSSTLTFQASAQGTFSAGNSVVNGIHPLPNSLTGGEGSVSGQEVLITTEFTNPIVLPTGHYFFAPEVALSNGTVTNTGGGAVTNDGGEAVTQMPGSFFGCRPMGRSSSLEICRRGLVTRIWNLTGCGWAPTSLGLDKTAVLPLNSIWPSPSTA